MGEVRVQVADLGCAEHAVGQRHRLDELLDDTSSASSRPLPDGLRAEFEWVSARACRNLAMAS